MTLSARTILYIEDDPASRMLVERTLTHAGYRVLVAERGLQGVDMARSESPDLILTDINLPDLSGRELTTMLRSDIRFEQTPIVALTAQAYKDQRDMTMAAGVTGYLTKPLDIEALPGQVEFYLNGGRDQVDLQTMAQAQTRYTQEVVNRLEARIRDLEAINDQLRRLERMKDTFIQLTAHELRTPLTLVYGYSRLVEDAPAINAALEMDANARAMMSGLTESIRRMQGIINEILTMSRIMANQIDLSVVQVNLGSLMQRVITTYQQALQDRRLTVQFDRDHFPNRIYADYDLLELALSNLMSNAIKYTPDGGTITVSAHIDGDQVIFSIKDTGIGISKHEQETLFERFYSVRDVSLHSTSKTAFCGGGIGLGLVICKGIIEAHGGHIWVESEKRSGEAFPGSEFIFVLPRVVQSTRRKTY